MGLFRRTPKGKHALGAAVTSIPSGPLRVAAPLMAAMQPPTPTPAPVDGPPTEPTEPTVLTSIAELIASGEAWASDLEDFHALHTPAADVPTAPSPLPPVRVPPPQAYVPPPPPLVEPVPVAPVPLPPVAQAPAAPVLLPVAPEASARASLEAALADLLPQQPGHPEEAYAAPAAPRVQLGFRDGTSASLDPESEQALALELLAQSLTRRD